METASADVLAGLVSRPPDLVAGLQRDTIAIKTRAIKMKTEIEKIYLACQESSPNVARSSVSVWSVSVLALVNSSTRTAKQNIVLARRQ